MMMHSQLRVYSNCAILALLVIGFAAKNAQGLAFDSQTATRRSFFGSVAASAASSATVAAAVSLIAGSVPPASASDAETTALLKLSDDELKQIVTDDLVKRQFLVTGDLTRSIYLPTATFTDEIDTYKMEQWITGTQKLFVGDRSHVRLVGDVNVDADKAEFRFDEDLCFNIPFKPVVHLTGRLELTRDASGYISKYQEYWDQDVVSVLKSAKF
jgi:hypothetical protein